MFIPCILVPFFYTHVFIFYKLKNMSNQFVYELRNCRSDEAHDYSETEKGNFYSII